MPWLIFAMLVFVATTAAAQETAFTCSIKGGELSTGGNSQGPVTFWVDDDHRHVRFEDGAEVSVGAYNSQEIVGKVRDHTLLEGGFDFVFDRQSGQFLRAFQLPGGMYVERGTCSAPGSPISKPVS
jgi:hypothetical protein